MQRCAPPGGTLEGADLGIEVVADLQLAFAHEDIEGDRRPLFGDHLADQLRHIGQRPTLLAHVSTEDRLLLLGARRVVHERHHAPVAGQGIVRNVQENRVGQPGNVDAVDFTFLEMPGDRAVAGSPIRVFAHPAGANRVAGAGFQHVTLKFVSHRFPPRCISTPRITAGPDCGCGQRFALVIFILGQVARGRPPLSRTAPPPPGSRPAARRRRRNSTPPAPPRAGSRCAAPPGISAATT